MVKKIAAILIIFAAISIPFMRLDVLPTIGDPTSAPNSHTSDYYIEHAVEDTAAPNLVTAVIVDYRAFDTLLETSVMFLAGMSVAIILSYKSKKQKVVIKHRLEDKSHALFYSRTKETIITILIPFLLIDALYVLFHGDLSIGGGFQAGALIGMAVLLDKMALPEKDIFAPISKNTAVSVAGAGTFIYALTGIVTLIGGGLFLEYGKIPLPIEYGELHFIGITMVEVGVTFGVAFTIITIITSMGERVSFDDDID